MIVELHKFHRNLYQLSHRDIVLYVSLEEGMTIFQLEYKNEIIIPYIEERHLNGMTHGIPLLYPTPNRTRDNRYIYEDTAGEAIPHGFIRNQFFELLRLVDNEERVELSAKYQHDERKDVFKDYPYQSDLTITIWISRNQIGIDYKVDNYDVKPMPYGFALHPFFQNNNMDGRIQVNGTSYMEMLEDKLPTGRILEVQDTEYDLRTSKLASSLNLDHVYTNLYGDYNSIITYEKYRIKLESTKEFGHMVVFTPKKPFFCVENQTCSTNAINLYRDGYEKESGLIIVEPGCSKKGQVIFTIEGV